MPNVWERFKAAFRAPRADDQGIDFPTLVLDIQVRSLDVIDAALAPGGWERLLARDRRRGGWSEQLGTMREAVARAEQAVAEQADQATDQAAQLLPVLEDGLALAAAVTDALAEQHRDLTASRDRLLERFQAYEDERRPFLSFLNPPSISGRDAAARDHVEALRGAGGARDTDADAFLDHLDMLGAELSRLHKHLQDFAEIYPPWPELERKARVASIAAEALYDPEGRRAAVSQALGTVRQHLQDGRYHHIEYHQPPETALAPCTKALQTHIQHTRRQRDWFGSRSEELGHRAAPALLSARALAPLDPPRLDLETALQAADAIDRAGEWIRGEAQAALDAVEQRLLVLEAQLRARDAWLAASVAPFDLAGRARGVDLAGASEDVRGAAGRVVRIQDAIEEHLDAARFDAATRALPQLLPPASAVLAWAGGAGLLRGGEPAAVFAELGAGELGSARVAGLCTALFGPGGTDGLDDGEAAQAAALEARFGVTVGTRSRRGRARWTASPGGPAKGCASLGALYQALAKAELKRSYSQLKDRARGMIKRARRAAPLAAAREALATALADLQADRTEGDFVGALDRVAGVRALTDALEARLLEKERVDAILSELSGRARKARKLWAALASQDIAGLEEAHEHRMQLREAVELATEAGDWSRAQGLLPELSEATDTVLALGLAHRLRRGGKKARRRLESLCAQPGGRQTVDRLVDRIDPGQDGSAPLLRLALEVRHGVTVKQFGRHHKGTGKRAPEDRDRANVERDPSTLHRMYTVFSQVPESHVRTNPSLKRITTWTQNDGGAAYSGVRKEVKMYCGRPGESHDENARLVLPSAFPQGVEPDCQPANNTPIEYFDWAALHEVGHAIDDAHGIMKGHLSDPAYGDWQVHTVKEVARAGASQPGLHPKLRSLIAAVLQGKTPKTLPKRPTGDDRWDERTWRAAIGRASEWAEAVRVDAGLWWDGPGTESSAVDGRVYQQAYPQLWVSYPLAERRRGMSGYQFRSHFEWFAELYAAHWSGKMKPSHPFSATLTALGGTPVEA